MKTNTAKKMIVSAMAIAMGAGIAGSISGTVAWYQYSTRATVEYGGVAAHCTEALEISVDGTNYASVLTADMIKTGAGVTDKLHPVTSGALALDSAPANLYKNPIYQYTDQATWGKGAANVDFAEFSIYARVKDLDGATGNDIKFLKDKPIYLTDVTIQASDVQGKYNLTNAVRVAVWTGAGEIGGQTNPATAFATYSANATTAAGVNTFGNLDLNNDGKLDTAKKYTFEGEADPLTYGTANTVALSYAANDLANGNTNHKIADDSNPNQIAGAALGNTDATDGHGVKICTIRIYLEGWTKLETGENATAIWDILKAKDAQFNVGLQFSTTVHENH